MNDPKAGTSFKPLVTAVIPTRNRPDLVLRAVYSALNQTYGNLEVVVVVDGPDAATAAVLGSITDPRLRVLQLSESVGGAEARNMGVRAALGEWIGSLDDDDEWLPNKIAVQMTVAENSAEQYPIICSRVIVRIPGLDYVWPKKLLRRNQPISEYLFVPTARGTGLCSTTTLLVRRKLLLNVPFTKHLKRHQDWDWILRATGQPNVSVEFAPEALAVWYMDESRARISNGNIRNWAYSLEWIRQVRPLITPRSYAAFLVTFVWPRAVAAHSARRSLSLIREAVCNGSPAASDLVFFCWESLLSPRRRRAVCRWLAAMVRRPIMVARRNSPLQSSFVGSQE